MIMNNSLIKFSVTIPTFKTQFLGDAIESVISQTYSNWELIIVNDASPEDIASIVKRYDDHRIRYFRNSINCGAVNVVDNWNICLNYCKSDYVICMGDDDMLMSCCLEEYAKLIEKYPKLNVYHALTDVIDELGNVTGHQRPRPEFQTAEELILHRWNGNIQFIGDFCYSVEHLRSEGGYFKQPLAWASDDITAVRAAEEGGIANTQIVCFLYRENSSSITSSRQNGLKLDAKARERQWYLEFFERHPLVSKELFPQAFDSWFRGQIGLHLEQLFEESLTNLPVALKKSNALGWNKTKILSKWFKVFKKQIVK